MNNNSSSLTYEQWLEKYFKSAQPIRVFKRKYGKGYITEEQALARYKRAFNSDNKK